MVSTLILSLFSASGTFTLNRILNIRKRNPSTSVPPSRKKVCASSCHMSSIVAGSFPRKSSMAQLTAIIPKGAGYFLANSALTSPILPNISLHKGDCATIPENCLSPSLERTPVKKSITATPSFFERSCLPLTSDTPMRSLASSDDIFWTWLLVAVSTAMSPH